MAGDAQNTLHLHRGKNVVFAGGRSAEVVTPGLFVDGVVEVPDPQQEELLIRTGVEYA